MADVFEEDEDEDEDEDGDKTPSELSSSDNLAVSTSEVDVSTSADESATPTQDHDTEMTDLKETSSAGSVKRKGSGSSLDLQPPGCRVRTETSTSSLHGSVIVEEDNGSKIIEDQVSATRFTEPNYASTTSPHRLICTNKDLSPVGTSLMDLSTSGTAVSPYSCVSHSSFQSSHSPMSYDAQRISTAPSSIHDEANFHSLLMGEPGPEVIRLSVDVPSLTSTNSTTTRESTLVRPRGMPFHDQRPASCTSTAFGRRRSSLASLSRLISSAHGERSKLSMEVAYDDEPEKKGKGSVTKRLSRKLQFWKAKESKTS
jgi:hypothetical protein